MRAETTPTGELRLYFTAPETQEVLKGIQNPSLEMEKPENAGPKWKPYDDIKPERPTKQLRKKTIEALKEIRDIAGLQRITTKDPDYVSILKSKGIRPGNFTQTLYVLEARHTVEIFMNKAGTQVASFTFKPSFKI